MCRPSARILRAVIELMAITLLVACSGGASTTPPPGTLQSTRYSLGGTVSGLTGSGLVLQSNSGEKLAARNGTFTFQTTLTTGTSYYVVVSVQPGTPIQSCSIANGTGTIGAANVTDIVVSCEDKTTNMDSVGGMVVGAQGPGLVLQNNGTDNLTVTASGAFKFPTQLPASSPYSVSVLSPPLDPYQDCIVTNSPGTTGPSDVADVVVSCTVNSNPKHTISVNVQSVTGTITLQNNGRDSLTVSSPGSYPFSIQIPTGSPYKVIASAVKGVQSESCTFQNGSGVVGGSDIDVLVSCAPAVVNDPITASVSGLSGTLVLEDNGGDNLSVTQNGPDTFATPLPAGATYNVTVFEQPTNQTCTVSNGTGTAGGNTPPPAVACVPSSIPITVTVVGLNGTGLVLEDNGGDNLAIGANGPFTFPTMIASGSPYNVTVLTQPTNPSQTCTVANATGTAGSPGPAPTVTCAVTITGTVTGLQGSGLVLQDNGGDNLAINGSGPFGFATPLQAGTTYNVSVLTQPTNPAQLCSVANPTGTTGSGGPAPVVNCLSYYTISGTVTGYNGDIGGNALILGNSNGDSVTMPENGSYASFTFAISLLSGSNYSITVSQQPGAYTVGSENKQTSTVCIVSSGSGTITANVTNVAVNCVQPAGFAYVTNGGDDSVSAYLVGADGALLSSGPPVSTGHIPSGAAAFIYQPPPGKGINVLPGVSLLYVTNQGSNDLSLYRIDPNTGALTSLSVSGSVYAPTSITLGESSITTAGVPPTLTLTAYVTGSTQPGGESPSTPVVYEFTSDASGTKLTPMAVSPMPSGTSGSLTTLQYLAVRSSQGTSGAYYLDTLLTADVMNAYALDSSNGSISPPPPPQPTYNTGPQPTSLDAIGSVKCIETSCDDGNFIYVANSKDGTISLFTQSSFGTITTPPKIQPGRIEGLSSLADDSYYLYATGSRGVWAFAPSTTDGSLKAVDGSPFAAGGGPGPIATTQPWYAGIVNPYFSEALNLVYTVNVTDRTISAFTINVKTGQLTSLTGPAVTTGAGPTSIIVQPRPVYSNGG